MQTNDIAIKISIIRKGRAGDTAVVGAPTITGKIPAKIGDEEIRKTILDALRQSYGEDFEETEGLDLSVS